MSPLRFRHVPCLSLIGALGLAFAGCSADGTSNDDVTFTHADVPFRFELPADFTTETVDGNNSRGTVVAVRALDKVNVIAVRRVSERPTATPKRLSVLGKRVTSIVYPVSGAQGWALECQYTADRRDEVVEACARARATLKLR